MNAKIEITGDGLCTKVLVNGVDISNEVSRVEFSHEGGEFAETALFFRSDNVSINSVAHVKLPNIARYALTHEQEEELLSK
jgi:hypothetical protein